MTWRLRLRTAVVKGGQMHVQAVPDLATRCPKANCRNRAKRGPSRAAESLDGMDSGMILMIALRFLHLESVQYLG